MIPRIKSSPFFALLCLLCIASGNITTFLIYMLAVISHECAHCVMADMLGYEVCSIELMPYGCRAEIVGIVSHSDELMIALAGPVFSLIAYMGTEVTGLESLKELSDANMYIALVNMLPVYPLDGGRALGAALEIVDIRLPYWANTVLNIALSIVLIFLGCMAENPTVTVFGVFFAAVAERDGGKKSFELSQKSGSSGLLQAYTCQAHSAKRKCYAVGSDLLFRRRKVYRNYCP